MVFIILLELYVAAPALLARWLSNDPGLFYLIYGLFNFFLIQLYIHAETKELTDCLPPLALALLNGFIVGCLMGAVYSFLIVLVCLGLPFVWLVRTNKNRAKRG